MAQLGRGAEQAQGEEGGRTRTRARWPSALGVSLIPFQTRTTRKASSMAGRWTHAARAAATIAAGTRMPPPTSTYSHAHGAAHHAHPRRRARPCR
eukprot:2422366-Prymnesium_polylepis.1